MENNKNHNTSKMAKKAEGIFCLVYLIYIFILAVYMLYFAGKTASLQKTTTYRLGITLALLLFFGDSFHLIPRIVSAFRGPVHRQTFYLGLGNLISSITMTVFYPVLVSGCHIIEYDSLEKASKQLIWLLILLVVRIVLLQFPQNRWFDGQGDERWAVIRNIPFAVIGVISVRSLLSIAFTAIQYPPSFYIQLAVLSIFSFLFYFPAAIWGRKKPKLGMLMIPKTICYMWMIALIAFI